MRVIVFVKATEHSEKELMKMTPENGLRRCARNDKISA